jgi:hypothetical protein
MSKDINELNQIDIAEWEDLTIKDLDHKLDTINYKFDELFADINNTLENIGISPINYKKKNERLAELIEDLKDLNKYAPQTVEDIQKYIDEPFFERFNKAGGVNDDLSAIKVNDYKVPNIFGITEEVEQTMFAGADRAINYDFSNKIVVKEKIGLEDIFNNSTLMGASGLPSFTDMFLEQYELYSLYSDGIAEIGFDNYVKALIHRADISHTIETDWLGQFLMWLPLVGDVINIIGAITGEHPITGKLLTMGESIWQGILAVGNLIIFTLSVISFGGGFAGLKGLFGEETIRASLINLAQGFSLEMGKGLVGNGAELVFGMISGLEQFGSYARFLTSFGFGKGAESMMKKFNIFSKADKTELWKKFDAFVDNYDFTVATVEFSLSDFELKESHRIEQILQCSEMIQIIRPTLDQMIKENKEIIFEITEESSPLTQEIIDYLRTETDYKKIIEIDGEWRITKK